MPITLNLKPEVELGLLESAKSLGVTLDSYLETMIQNSITATKASQSTGAERAKAIMERAKSHRITEPLSDEAISRASMYPYRD
jgi:hypothetical protein